MKVRQITFLMTSLVVFLIGLLGKYARKKPNKVESSQRVLMPKFFLILANIFISVGLLLLFLVGSLFMTGQTASSAGVGLGLIAIGIMLFGWLLRHIYQSFYIEFQENYVKQRTAFLRKEKIIRYADITYYEYYEESGHQYIHIVDKKNKKMDIDTTFFTIDRLLEKIALIEEKSPRHRIS
ncbi:hypothetical protein [Tetragenococcus solitarius]|uniref:DUF5673 domain-containing protein n=1 Tax=Tetragenococcus solitarius TaxID=71453 RepID=A0ABN3Y0Z9_9ENTE|nr:hypothetical protein [Tetragenococcus solitarius]